MRLKFLALFFVLLGQTLCLGQTDFSDDDPMSLPGAESQAVAVPVEREKSYIDKFLGPQFKAKIQEMIQENPFGSMERETLRSMIGKAFQDKPVGRLIEKYPKVLDFVLDVLQDDEALPALFSLIEKEEKLKNFGFISLGIFIAFLVAGLMNSKGSLLRRLFIKLFLSVAFLAVYLGSISYYFRVELSPIFRILKRYVGL